MIKFPEKCQLRLQRFADGCHDLLAHHSASASLAPSCIHALSELKKSEVVV